MTEILFYLRCFWLRAIAVSERKQNKFYQNHRRYLIAQAWRVTACTTTEYTKPFGTAGITAVNCNTLYTYVFRSSTSFSFTLKSEIRHSYLKRLVNFHNLHTRFLRDSYKHYMGARSFIHFLQWKSNKYCKFWVCAYSLSYVAYKAHAPLYIVICGLSGCILFFHIISLKVTASVV